MDARSSLTPWQREMVERLLDGVPQSLLVSRGRRAGWTTMLSVVEDALKWRGPWPFILWDGKTYDPD